MNPSALNQTARSSETSGRRARREGLWGYWEQDKARKVKIKGTDNSSKKNMKITVSSDWKLEVVPILKLRKYGNETLQRFNT